MLSDLLALNQSDSSRHHSDVNSATTNTNDNNHLVLSPVKLAEGLTDQIEEIETTSASVLNRIQSPSLFRPEIYS
ncbi:unnamed protein product [Trichobilharzia regenti]|nr:unnamed protein product [Trichobilharzia regenti]